MDGPRGCLQLWPPRSTALFEYHCWESDKSGDAILWHHSHQTVTVGPPTKEVLFAVATPTMQERADEGCPVLYEVTFTCGCAATVFEDELMTSAQQFYRPNPPAGPHVPIG